MELLDVRAVDMRLHYRGMERASSDVVIVAIDDASIETIGRWPWPRATMAKLLDSLSAAKPAVIGFDVVQSEESIAPVLRSLGDRIDGVDARTWQRVESALRRWSEEDKLFAASVKRAGNVVLGYFFEPTLEKERAGAKLTHFGVVRNSAGERGLSRLPQADAAITNLAVLEQAAAATGYFNVYPDTADGLFRRVPMAIRHGEDVALPLTLAMLQVYWGSAQTTLKVAEFGAESVTIGTHRIPVSEDARLMLNYRGPRKMFRHVSASDVLAHKIDPALLRDRLVLVGVTAGAVADVRATPFDALFPGVEIHATALDNVLREDYLKQPDFLVAVEIAIVIVFTLVLGYVLRHARGIWGALAAFALAGSYLVASQSLFIATGIALGVVFPVATLVLSYVTIGAQQFAVERSEKRQVREMFARYVTPEVAMRVSERPDLVKLGGEKRNLTLMFCDIRGFTTIAEQAAPEALVEMLNEYLTAMTEIVFAHGGTLDKYIGDAVMAFWGAPVAHDDDPARACRAALEMRDRARILQTRWQSRGWPKLEIGIGIHTGEVIVGNMGSERRLAYTAVGDDVNLASRLEGLTKKYAVTLIASEMTIAAAREAVFAREVDVVRVRGRSQPVRIFEVCGVSAERGEHALVFERFAEGLSAYREREWRAAHAAFEDVLRVRPDDGPARMYLNRCQVYMISAPSAAWDGIAAAE